MKNHLCPNCECLIHNNVTHVVGKDKSGESVYSCHRYTGEEFDEE